MRSWKLVAVATLTLGSCASTNDTSLTPPVTDQPVVSSLQERGLLLLLADRRIFEPFTVQSIERREEAGLRVALAVTLGRAGESRGRLVLESLISDRQPEVRRAAAFSLGQLARAESSRYLLAAVADPDLETGIWAVEALARLDTDLAQVIEAGSELSAEALWSRLLPYLFRFPAAQLLPVARQALGLPQPGYRSAAAYALARTQHPEAAPLLRPLLVDPDPWVRGWAARALGEVGNGSDLERLRPLLADSDPGPIIQSLRAAQRLLARGAAAPPADWRQALLQLLEDPRPGVALTALESSSAWLLNAEISKRLAGFAEHGERRQSELALLALARGRDDRAADLSARFAVSGDDSRRALAAAAAALIADFELLDMLAADPSARVRSAALTGRLEAAAETAGVWARNALSDPDPVVRTVALEWLAEHPVATAEEIGLALSGRQGAGIIELRLNGIRALVARGRSEPLERGLVVENLESLTRVGEYPARREAADGLVALERERPPTGPADDRKSARVYEDILLRTAASRLVDIDTRHGRLRLRLDCPMVPMTCINFLQLVGQGFYDGLVFHRVVPGFVVQAGDPRGDGWGGPGYTIRDELNRTPFERGVIGMASSGRDTAGSQFFIALSRQPHLDARYTAFGRVIEGDEILDQLVQGEPMERVREVP